MSDHNNIRIIQEYLSSRSPEYMADDVICHDYSQPEPIRGRQAVDELVDSFYRTGFSDAKLEIRHITGNDNGVTLEVTFHGVNTGPLRGHPPSGKRVELPACGVYEIAGGLIYCVRIYYDNGLLERQLGWVADE